MYRILGTVFNQEILPSSFLVRHVARWWRVRSSVSVRFFPSFSSMFPETKTSNEQQNTKMHRLVQTQHHTNERKSKSIHLVGHSVVHISVHWHWPRAVRLIITTLSTVTSVSRVCSQYWIILNGKNNEVLRNSRGTRQSTSESDQFQTRSHPPLTPIEMFQTDRVLLLHGSKDNVVPFRSTTRFRDSKLLKRVKHVRCLIVKNAGHVVRSWMWWKEGQAFVLWRGCDKEQAEVRRVRKGFRCGFGVYCWCCLMGEEKVVEMRVVWDETWWMLLSFFLILLWGERHVCVCIR